jgi:hypothetical protein
MSSRQIDLNRLRAGIDVRSVQRWLGFRTPRTPRSFH